MKLPLGASTNDSRHGVNAASPQRKSIWKRPEMPARNVREIKPSIKENTENMQTFTFPTLTTEEFLRRKKEFTTFKFYLDNLEPSIQKRIERGIKLLGAEQENFFSNKCTHVITTKPIPIHENLLQTKNDTNPTNTANQLKKPLVRDNIVDNAIQWNLVLWSVEVMWKTIEFFLRTTRKETQERRPLGKALQEEKLYGPSTGVNNDAQAKRPQFTPFDGHYMLLEDADQIHRPPVIKQFTKKVYTKKANNYPWPYLKTTPKPKSPFCKRPSPPPPPPPPSQTLLRQEKPKKNPAFDLFKDEMENYDPLWEANLHQQQIMLPPSESILVRREGPPKPFVMPDYYRPDGPVPESLQFSLRASGVQPYTNNVPSTSRSTIDNRRLPHGQSINMLGKRTIENITQDPAEVKVEEQQEEHQQKRKRELRFCENCNVLFESLEEHTKEKTHQTFIRDPNNFKQLDLLFEKTRRVYKSPLPEHMRPFIDTNIDGENVEFLPSNNKKKMNEDDDEEEESL